MFSSGRSKCLLLPQRESKQAATLTTATRRQDCDEQGLKLNWSGNKFAACLHISAHLGHLDVVARVKTISLTYQMETGSR